MRRVLIVRLDAIGDYILWRNCLGFLRRSRKYRDAHITVFGNPAWRSLAEAFDAGIADEWLWAERRDALFRMGRENLLPRCIWHARVAAAQEKEKRRLLEMGFDEVISPSAFPDALLDEFVCGLAPVAIGVDTGDGTRHSRFTRLVSAGDGAFVFERNLAIASALAGERCDARLELELPGRPKPERLIMLYKSASHWTRRWPERKWAALRRLAPSGYEIADAPMTRTLPDFARALASCAAVVSNDTMALHMAAALGVPAVCVANGVSGKSSFWPYPKELGKAVETCAPDKTPHIPIPLLGPRLAQWLALNSVSPSDVAAALARILCE